ncbi:MAG: serine--tRNA ligase [Patescibacteria group bacterium]|nr:serine--tRNA ligase [Patescibacteria group bacterium]
MLDIKYIRENLETVKNAIKVKNVNIDIDRLLELDDKRRSLAQKLEQLNVQKKEAAKTQNHELGKKIKNDTQKLEADLKPIETEFRDLMLLVPQIPNKSSPIGPDSSYNAEIKKCDSMPKFAFTPKDHIELMTKLDLADFERGVKIHGFRGYILKNEAALMQFGLMQLGLEKMRERNFTITVPPVVVREEALISSGFFPAAKDETYILQSKGSDDESANNEREGKFLAGTAEVALVHMHSNETFKEEDLPIKLCGISSCFRTEIGSYGKDSRGIYRINEFWKVEQVVICKADMEENERLFNEMRAISEELITDLKLPYRVVNTSTGDMGAGKYMMHDIEIWWPGRKDWGEFGSCSSLLDWQARRANIKYQAKSGEKKHVYILNNTMVASPRLLGAIVENYQQEDGSVIVPEVLRRFVGKDIIS